MEVLSIKKSAYRIELMNNVNINSGREFRYNQVPQPTTEEGVIPIIDEFSKIYDEEEISWDLSKANLKLGVPHLKIPGSIKYVYWRNLNLSNNGIRVEELSSSFFEIDAEYLFIFRRRQRFYL